METALRLWLAFSLPALAAAPLLRRAFPGLRDGGASIARPASWLLIAWLAWFPTSLPGLSFYGTPLVVAATAALVALGAWIAWQDRAAWRALLAAEWRTILLGEAVGLAVLGAVLWLVKYNGDIHPLAERFMDYAILKRLELTSAFPPQDSWMAGLTLQYYYYGYVVMDVLRRLAALELRAFFNPAIAGVYASFAIALYGAGIAVGRSRAAGVAAVVGGALVGNYEFARQIAVAWWKTGDWKLLGLDWFRVSRVIDGTINETPVFAGFWGDLHPYLIAFPFVVLAITLAVTALLAGMHPLAGDRPRTDKLLALALLVIPLGALYPTNSWDFPTFLGLALAALAWPLIDFAALGKAWEAVRERTAGVLSGLGRPDNELVLAARSLRKPALIAGAVAVLAVAAYFAFHVGFGKQVGRGVRLAQRRSDVIPMLIHFGPWFAAIALWAVATAPDRAARLRRLVPLVGAAVALVAFEWWAVPAVEGAVKSLAESGAGFLAVGAKHLLLHGLAFVLVIAGLWVLVSDLDGASIRTPEGASRLLAAAALFVVLVCEFAYVDDFYGGKNERMNTVFKAYIQAWILLAVGSAGLLAAAWRALPRGAAKAVFAGAGAAALVPALAFAALGDYNRSGGFERTRSGNEPTMDPLDLFRERFPSDYVATRWVEENLPPDAVVLEAAAHAYEWESRVATFSGRRTLIGWKNHESGWRNDWELATGRGSVVDRIYESESLDEALALCREHGIDYVFVGERERARAMLPAELPAEDVRAILGAPMQIARGTGAVFGRAVSRWERWSYGTFTVWMADGHLARSDQKNATYRLTKFAALPVVYSGDRVAIYRVPARAPGTEEPVMSRN